MLGQTLVHFFVLRASFERKRRFAQKARSSRRRLATKRHKMHKRDWNVLAEEMRRAERAVGGGRVLFGARALFMH